MRVKTETLQLLDDCRQYTDCKECPAKAICEDGEKDEYVRTDLIEARELIKEMRGIINSAVCMDYDPNCDCTGCNDVGGQMQSILEKSKDYA